MPHKHFYEFGPFRVDILLNRLERAGRAIPLPPKAFDLLALLARHTDRLMAKTELMEALWPNTFVEEANLTQHVYTLRKALGDRPDGLPYIETVPRRGYRLASDVRCVSGDEPRAALRADSPGPVMREAERRHATVLQCRVSAAADVVERLGSAAARDLTRELLVLAADETARYEGVLTDRHADGFTAVFGVPAVHEDDARRATLAAMEIRRRFRAIAPAGETPGDRIDIQIGINTGPLVVSGVTTDGRVEYAAVGDAARIADLLEQIAEPGAILIGEATRRAVEGFVEVVGTAGRAGGAPAYRAVRLCSTGTAPSTRIARTLARFVGRQEQLSLLEGLAARARDGQGQAVSIVGAPGMGKSRLLYELTRTAAADASMTALEGRCVSYGSVIPYLPLVDLIRAHCGIGDSDAPDAIRHAVERTVASHSLPADRAAWILRVMGIADGAGTIEPASPEAIKARTFDALRSLFLEASTRTPLLIAIEDVHWIDRTSEEFVATLVERVVAARVMVVATYRPGYRPPWLDRSYLAQITLAPLTTADGARLVGSVAGQRPLGEAVSAALVAKAEGNPFFLEELARTVVERGPGAEGIPETVHGVIMSRVDRLPETAKQVLQTASVLGREVPLPLLARVWCGDGLESALAELCRLEFMYEGPGGDETVFIFTHALTQDVAYDSLLARSRRALHLRAAEALAALHGDRRDDLAATFAHHYARTDRVDDAVWWLTRAAEQAARVYANAEAILHLDLAARRLERLPEGPDRDRRILEVALLHAHSLYFLGRFRESVDVLMPHEARLSRLSDAALSARYLFWLAHMYSRLGDQTRAADSANRAIDAGTRAGDPATVGKAHGLLALEGHWSGNPADGIVHGEEAVRILETHPEQRWWLGMAHFYLAVNHLLTGDFVAALAEAGRADAMGKEIGDPRLETYAGYTTGWIEASRGNTEVAIAACRRSLERAPDRVSRAYAALFLAFALLEAGEHEQALAQLRPTLAALEGFAFPQWHGLAAALLADAFRQSGRLADASASVRTGVEVATRARYWYGVGVAERIAARIARDQSRLEDAAAAFDRALEIFERIGARFEAWRTHAEAAQRTGAV